MALCQLRGFIASGLADRVSATFYTRGSKRRCYEDRPARRSLVFRSAAMMRCRGQPCFFIATVAEVVAEYATSARTWRRP